MIFQYTWPAVVNETKSITRRVVKSKETAVRGRYNRIEAILCNGRTKWEVGKTYAVQPGRGKQQIARIRLTRIRSENVTRISTSDAIAEGFQSRQDFLKTWLQIHGSGGFDRRVWVLEFELTAIRVDMPVLEPHKASIPLH